MSFAWQDIRYGWKALAGIVLTGATIYVAVSTRQRVTQRDIIEIVLGTYERCLATQYGTNEAGAPLYYVAPPEFTRDWVGTNGAGGWQTNAVTNAIGWRTDRAMLASCDALIKACVPYYADTGTLEALTVTGLWASLGIGDGTNLFTREPAWVGTNGMTNPATYGEYPHRIYKTDLEERYKVLNALGQTVIAGGDVHFGDPWKVLLRQQARDEMLFGNQSNWVECVEYAEGAWLGYSITNYNTNLVSAPLLIYTLGVLYQEVEIRPYYHGLYSHIAVPTEASNKLSAVIAHTIKNMFFASLPYGGTWWGGIPTNGAVFDANGLPLALNAWSEVPATEISLSCDAIPEWCEEPDASSEEYDGIYYEARGLRVEHKNMRLCATWAFQYATNRYW